MSAKIYYRQVKGDKYSLVYCSWCGKPGVSYNIVEMKENGVSYKVGVNLPGKGYFSLKMIKAIALKRKRHTG